jgi:hypothetical protein
LSEEQKLQAGVSAILGEEMAKPKYVTPQIKVLTEQQVLSAFQVTAAGTTMWWA